MSPEADPPEAPSLSVVICTHEPRPDHLGRVLDALRGQTFDRRGWELVVIDNASRRPLAGSLDLSWHPRARLVREEELGLTAARVRSLRETAAGVLVFVDDDNVLADDYLEVAARLAATHARLGAWGGQLHPEFEVAPDAALRPYLSAIGIREFVGDHRSSRVRDWETAPYGAGLCVRRAVLDHYVEQVGRDALRAALGARGTVLLRCEDVDLAFTATDLGFETGLFEQLNLIHLFPAVRTTEAYVLRLYEGNAFSGTIVEHVHGGGLDRSGPARPMRRVARRVRRGRLAARVRAAQDRGRLAAVDRIDAPSVAGRAPRGGADT